MRKLYRSRVHRLICGVCGGLSEYLGVDPTIIRLAAIALFIINPAVAAVLYIAACIIMPEKPSTEGEVEHETKELLKDIKQGLAEGLRGVGIIVGIILVILGLVMILSNVWPTLIDLLWHVWESLLAFNKVIAGLLLLIIGLVLIALSEARKKKTASF